MTSFQAAVGSGETWLRASDDCLARLGALPADANLGIIYVSSPLAHALDLIVTRLKEVTGIDDWVGTGGAGVCSSRGSTDGGGAISILATALPRDGFQLFDGLGDRPGVRSVSSMSAGPSSPLAIVHGDPRQTRTPAMIKRFGEDSGAFLVGGLTSAIGDGAMQIAGRPTEGGLSGVLMSQEVPMITGLTQGCSPIGPVREITGMDGPWITTLDGAPAFDSLKADVGPLLGRHPARIAGFILAALPETAGDRRDYLVRDLGDIDPLDGRLMVGDDLSRGDPLCFVKRDPEGAQTDLRRLTADLRKRADGRPVKGALYHSCVARGRHLFGTDEAELAIIEEELGPIPLAGFQTHGEIFRDRLYGYAAVLTLFLG